MAALGRIERSLSGKNVRPMASDDPKNLETFLPMLGEHRRHQLLQLVERRPLGLQFIQERGEIVGQASRLIGAPAKRFQQARQQ